MIGWARCNDWCGCKSEDDCLKSPANAAYAAEQIAAFPSFPPPQVESLHGCPECGRQDMHNFNCSIGKRNRARYRGP